MTGFVLAALALTALTLAFLLPPLWRGARPWALALMIALPLLAAGLYVLVGTPAALAPDAVQDDSDGGGPRMNLEQALAGLRARLQQEPDDLEGWRLLGRSLRVQEDFEGSRQALAEAYRLAPEDPDVLVEYAEALVLVRDDRRIEGEPLALIERALASAPEHQRGLLLLGAARIQAGHTAEGAAVWERLLELVPAETRPSLRQRIDAVRAEAGLPPLPPETGVATPELTLDIDLAAPLGEPLPPQAALFVLARPIDAPGAPFAAKRLGAGTFPVTVRLGEADSPMAGGRLFEQPRVRLVARISLQGQADRRPGDLEGTLDIAPEPGARVALRIDRMVE